MEYDKQKYMEGAVWMGKKVTNEIERVCQQIDSIIKEYHQRINDQTQSQKGASFGFRPTDIVTLQRCQAWFLEAIKNCNYELYEKSVTMLESAIIHMDEAQKKLNEAEAVTSKEDSGNLLTNISTKPMNRGGNFPQNEFSN